MIDYMTTYLSEASVNSLLVSLCQLVITFLVCASSLSAKLVQCWLVLLGILDSCSQLVYDSHTCEEEYSMALEAGAIVQTFASGRGQQPPVASSGSCRMM